MTNIEKIQAEIEKEVQHKNLTRDITNNIQGKNKEMCRYGKKRKAKKT